MQSNLLDKDRTVTLLWATAEARPTICAECDRKRKGHPTEDNHRPAGSANSPVTMPIAVNDHRAILSVAQYDRPKDTVENPNADPKRQLESETPATYQLQFACRPYCRPPLLGGFDNCLSAGGAELPLFTDRRGGGVRRRTTRPLSGPPLPLGSGDPSSRCG